ncbi:alcohol dehydrogenase [Colletotrichum tabaci]|uniref:Alcohol dehydrogenase n=1 Tax=Colletotrichum tabaci TaxID=1209068 RepID=A0AAV9T200_9PEZI
MIRGDKDFGQKSDYYCLIEAFQDILEHEEDRKYLRAVNSMIVKHGLEPLPLY